MGAVIYSKTLDNSALHPHKRGKTDPKFFVFRFSPGSLKGFTPQGPETFTPLIELKIDIAVVASLRASFPQRCKAGQNFNGQNLSVKLFPNENVALEEGSFCSYGEGTLTYALIASFMIMHL